MPHFDRHVFICTNERAADHPRGSCKAKGSPEVRDHLKKVLTEHGLGKRIRANNAGCLDQCEAGVVVVVYPEQVWYGAVTLADVDAIVTEHLLGGRIVERLLIADQAHLTPRPALPTLAPEPLVKLGLGKPKA